ncbi:Tetratricopeptide TPR_2 repeat-containing protein [Gemmatirosa kalamazoonensis]|uniref:Tetratricopeptide TPR_2 repeat-containing protein n=1 Tax=Gemmatirosa kalamazoonensis TaxID=861299 RepID=W0RHJ5_9BACT|nr:tetratricopeptide repeat protein [Gemmatirosa kalamazoonensis]AHG90594.1 Tetratricopeptide TPR_2 repeat-containing protein [Gemmatirosa kalamazoonensis]
MSQQDAGALAALARRADPADAGAQNNLGVVLLARGERAGAAAAFARALALDPRMTLARSNLDAAGGLAVRAQRAQELRARVRADGGDLDARRELALLLAETGRADDARREFDALCALAPDAPGPRILRALFEQRVGDLDAAEAWLTQAIALDPRAALPRAHLGEVVYHRGEPARALAVLDGAIALAPEHADAHWVRGFVLGELGRADDAAAATARALALNPSLGRAQLNLAAPGVAPEEVAAAVAAAPSAPLGGADVNLALGLALREKGYFDEAVREYRRALACGADERHVARALGELHLLRGAPADALPHLSRLVELAPDDAASWHALGVAAHLAGRVVDSEDAYRRGVALAGQRRAAAPILNDLGVLRAARGERAEAVELLGAAVRLDPTLRRVRLNHAQLLVATGAHDRALAEYRAVLRDAAADADAWTGLGAMLAAAGRTADARAALARALDADPSRADARYELGFLAAAAGDLSAARREAEHAMAHAPLVMRRPLELALDLGGAVPLTVAPAPDALDAPVHGFSIAEDALDALLGDVLAPAEEPSDPTAPNDPARAFVVAEECLRAGLYERASAAVSAALARGADRATGLVLLADAFAAQGYFGEALERYQEARQADAASLRARLGELRMLRETGRRDASLAAADAFVADHPAHAEALALLAVARADAGDPDAAREALGRAEAFADDADVWALVAQAWRALGEHDAEADACGRGLALAPERWRLRLTLARALAAAGHDDAAEAALAPLVEPASGGARLVEPCVEMAALRAHAGDRRGARALLVDVLAADPLHVDALAQLGALLLDEGRLVDAAVAVRRVLRLEPEHALALALDGELLVHAGDVPNARARWRRVVELEPASVGAMRARRGLSAHAGRVEAAA